MEVISIADYDRKCARELDSHISSAVDQLVALSEPDTPKVPLTEIIHRFGMFQLDDDGFPLPFDFSTPTTCRRWPGPHFGASSLHKVIAKAPTKAKPKSQEKQREVCRRHQPRAQTTTTKKPARSKPLLDVGPSQSTSKTASSPSLRLMDVPAEIRNLIWSLLATRGEPVEAQLRQIQPSKKLRRNSKKVIRRFPQEPAVAQTSKQVRKEVLSIFYGTNHFIFERNACNVFKDYSMLNPVNMKLWKPNADFAGFLTRVDIRFNALPRTSGNMVQVVYGLRKAVDSKATVSVKLDKTSSNGKKKKHVDTKQFCLCAETDVVDEVNGATVMEQDRDLADLAMDLVRKRHETMFRGLGVKKTSNFYPAALSCTRCARETFEIVYSGM